MIGNGLAKCVLGYGLRTGNIDNIEVVDIDEHREIAFVWLERKSGSADCEGSWILGAEEK
ncbi:MAG: hypothetical protein FGF53_02835 [Candidatus Brockarchaeota archaeon]|nr:hypothetical protein [Candidatus Brockarchaeota archaeon]MBO3808063.1 hypothetical protein [Candidatus Brockarchaeota archaeon]MBO3841641.1 hypothetical protein [Candidatus Brockarchaeota archaeon]